MYKFVIVGLFGNSMKDVENNVGVKHVVLNSKFPNDCDFNEAKNILAKNVIDSGSFRFCKLYYKEIEAKNNKKGEYTPSKNQNMRNFVSYFEFMPGYPPYYEDSGWAEIVG